MPIADPITILIVLGRAVLDSIGRTIGDAVGLSTAAAFVSFVVGSVLAD